MKEAIKKRGNVEERKREGGEERGLQREYVKEERRMSGCSR